jgi:tricarballylate dehydrogenase
MANDDFYDFLIVGCGAAGLSAAVSYAQAARSAGEQPRIAVLEAAPEAERGGATRWTTAGLRGTMSTGLDPFWVGLAADLSKGLTDLDICSALERETSASFRFLHDHGVEFIERENPLANSMHGKISLPNGGGHAIVEHLVQALDAVGFGEIHYQTEAVRLTLCERGRVDGVVVRGPDGLLRTMRSHAILLACGGFEGNAEMMTQYVGPKACDLKLIAPGVKYNRGAGIKMAMEIGAGTAGQFDGIHAEAVDSRTDRADAVIYAHTYGIVVNEHGQRFFDEGQNTFDATFELLGYDIWRHQNQTAFFIADRHIHDFPAILAMFDTDQPPVEAETIADLAAQLGLEPNALAATVDAYNAAVGPGEFDPRRLDGKATVGLVPPKSNWAYPLDRGPFLAYPLTAAVTFTYGGLKTDTLARVLTGNGVVIPGLYAAGEIAGLFYHEYPSATSVLRAVTFGRIAGRHAADALVAA